MSDMSEMSQSVSCEHYWASHVQGGRKLSVRICKLCQAIDWDDLDEQADAIRLLATAAGRQCCAQLALEKADRGAKSGLDRIALRAFAAELLRETP